jgi:hypothetical protein
MPPLPPIEWEEVEDIHDQILRTGRLWADTGISGVRAYESHYEIEPEKVDQKNAANLKRALVQYEYNKPENLHLRIMQAAHLAQQREKARVEQEAKLAEQRRQLALTLQAEQEREQRAREARARAEQERHAKGLEEAKRWWVEFDPGYKNEKFSFVTVRRTRSYRTIDLKAGQQYYLPHTFIAAIKGALI